MERCGGNAVKEERMLWKAISPKAVTRRGRLKTNCPKRETKEEPLKVCLNDRADPTLAQ